MLECRCRQQGLGYDQCTLAKAACATETESTPTLPDASAGPEEKHKGFIGHIQARQPSYNPKKNRVIARYKQSLLKSPEIHSSEDKIRAMLIDQRERKPLLCFHGED